MPLYPTEQWLEAYGEAIRENEVLDDFGFDENILLVVTDLQLYETTIGDLPDSILEELPENVREGLADVSLAEAISLINERVRSSLPEAMEELLNQTERDVVDETLYVYIELDDGDCAEITLVTDPNERDVDSTFRATAHTWQSIVAGRPAASAVLCGDVEIIGNELLKLQYATELQVLCDVAAEVETDFLFEHHSRSVLDLLLDESIRQPLAMQKFVHRQADIAMQLFTPF